MDCFTAIDFETAQGYRWSICQVGLVRVEYGKITNEVNILVQPPNNYYWDRFINIHGITPTSTANAPTFDKVWHKKVLFLGYQIVVLTHLLFYSFIFSF